MNFKDIVQNRYATKLFDGRKVPDEQIDELLDYIRLSASSFGLQPYQVLVVADQELKQKLKAFSWDQPQITTCSHLLIFCVIKNVLSRIDDYAELMRKEGVPEEKISAYTNMMRSALSGRSEQELFEWAARQAYIALGNALNGAKALGFDSCPIEGFSPDDYAELLGLTDKIPVVVCPVGYAADKPRPKIRFPKEALFNHR